MFSDFHDYPERLNHCPKCGKQALAKVSDHHYRCVWCHFRRDLSEGGMGDSGAFFFLLFVAALIVVIVL